MKFILILVFIISCAQNSPYEHYARKTWQHWIDEDRDCLNTRAEILSQRSKIQVTMNKKGCVVRSGKWDDYYYPEVHYSASRVDIDHLVPLKNAHLSGGSSWGPLKRKAFANDPENLVITNLSYNRKKGAKGIDEWLPVHPHYACKYVKDWIKIKNKYSLTLSYKEMNSIKNLKKLNCKL